MPRLGIGLPYLQSLPQELYRPELLDFVEITPETLCSPKRTRTGLAIELVSEKVERARSTCHPLPIVVHGVELSIGSAHGFNNAYLKMLDSFQASWPFIWHSEHLGFQTIEGDSGTTLEVGVPLPLPPTREAAELVADRGAMIQTRYGVPFLLENPAHYLAALPTDPEIGDDTGLMTAILNRSGCFQLLDLHNVHCNAVNHGSDPFVIIERMPLTRAAEIHVAGGAWHEGFWMDAHDGRVPNQGLGIAAVHPVSGSERGRHRVRVA